MAAVGLVTGLSGVPQQVLAEPVFAQRGYYMTLMRMPRMNFDHWRVMIDRIQADGGNLVILWMGGGFRSEKFPITWAYNAEHANVRQDFVRRLIDHAHTRQLRVLLALTPYGYDGVNQWARKHPELKARQADGTPVAPFGIHCWGWSLCPSQPQSQQFMREYARELLFQFYPNADGLLIESSDYNICRCPDCRKGYYDREFAFVRQISDELWAHNPEAMIVVYPHYFSGKQINAGTEIATQAARQPWDPRWTLFFTPHSAAVDPQLLQRATSSIYWDDSPSLRTPWQIRQAAQMARQAGVTGFVPSLEPWSYVMTQVEFDQPHLLNRRLRPFGLDWIEPDAMPLDPLLVRVQRCAYRAFCSDPGMSDRRFKQVLAETIFGDAEQLAAAEDLLALQQIVFSGRSWVSASLVVQPELVARRRDRLSEEQCRQLRDQLDQLQILARRYAAASNAPGQQMGRIAQFIVDRWTAADLEKVLDRGRSDNKSLSP